MKTIILTVQSNGTGGWRLGINQEDSKNIFKCRKAKVRLLLPKDIIIECYTACGNPCDETGDWIRLNPKTSMPYAKKGYDLNKKELSTWLSENYKNEFERKPRKLKFYFYMESEVFILKFVSEVV